MPSRTYIQMYIETGRYHYIVKDRRYYVAVLINAYRYLCNHPEKVEEIVKERVRVGKFIRSEKWPNTPFQWLFLELQVINSWIVDDTVRKQERFAESFKEALINTLEDDKTPNPIYIPKHIQHRKKGRK